jgi:hypothetical protein
VLIGAPAVDCHFLSPLLGGHAEVVCAGEMCAEVVCAGEKIAAALDSAVRVPCALLRSLSIAYHGLRAGTETADPMLPEPLFDLEPRSSLPKAAFMSGEHPSGLGHVLAPLPL